MDNEILPAVALAMGIAGLVTSIMGIEVFRILYGIGLIALASNELHK